MHICTAHIARSHAGKWFLSGNNVPKKQPKTRCTAMLPINAAVYFTPWRQTENHMPNAFPFVSFPIEPAARCPGPTIPIVAWVNQPEACVVLCFSGARHLTPTPNRNQTRHGSNVLPSFRSPSIFCAPSLLGRVKCNVTFCRGASDNGCACDGVTLTLHPWWSGRLLDDTRAAISLFLIDPTHSSDPARYPSRMRERRHHRLLPVERIGFSFSTRPLTSSFGHRSVLFSNQASLR